MENLWNILFAINMGKYSLFYKAKIEKIVDE